jgi:hypothetical protein
VKLVVLVAAVLAGLPFGLCSDDDGPTAPSGARALQTVRTIFGQAQTDPVGVSYNCQYTFGPSAGLEPVLQSCLWRLEEQDGSWLVTFHKVWQCTDFSGEVENYPPCDGETGFHEWTYLVDPAGQPELLEESGQFPPDYVQAQ